MFIKTIYNKDMEKVLRDKSPMFREIKIGWPSESLCSVGNGFNIGECQRSLFYKILGQEYTEPGSLRLKKICESGIMYEEQSIKEAKEHGMYIADQIKIEFKMPNIKNDITISGKMDLLILDDGVFKGIEIKTIDTYKADAIFGSMSGSLPLPAANNLMQAMLYKYHLSRTIVTDAGVKVTEVYLKYINRANGAEMYYLVDIDNEGYPIVTSITENGTYGSTIRFQEVKSFEQLANRSEIATSEESRLAELRFKMQDIFDKFDTTYDYVGNKVLPPKDYELIYSPARIELERKVGRISTIKYNKAKKGTPIGDKKCGFCNYRSKCLKDSGLGKIDMTDFSEFED